MFCLFYYSGHGQIVEGTFRTVLIDKEDFELEVSIRNFKNEHESNSFSFAIFDACRNVVGANPRGQVKGRS